MKKKLALILLACTLVMSCTGCNVMNAFTEAFFAELANSDEDDEDEDDEKESKKSKESEESEESKESDESKESEESKASEESKESKESEESKETKESEESKETKETKESEESKETKESEPSSEPSTSLGSATDELHPLTGTLDGNTYINSELGIQCTLDNSWWYYGTDELEERSGITFDTTSFDDALDNGSAPCIMYAKTGTGPNVSIEVDTTGYIITLYGLEEFYAELETQMESEVVATYTALGFKDIEFETIDVTFLGETVPCFQMKATYLGETMCLRQIFRPVGEYCMSLTVTHNTEEGAQEVLDSFSTLN